MNVFSLQSSKAPSPVSKSKEVVAPKGVKKPDGLKSRDEIASLKKDVAIRKQREHIGSVVERVSELQQLLGTTKVQESATEQAKIMKELKTLKPPFLDPSSLKKGISEIKTGSKKSLISSPALTRINTKIKTLETDRQKLFDDLGALDEQTTIDIGRLKSDIETKRKSLQQKLARAKMSVTPDLEAKELRRQASELRTEINGLQTQILNKQRLLTQKKVQVKQKDRQIAATLSKLKKRRASLGSESGSEILRKKAIDSVAKDLTKDRLALRSKMLTQSAKIRSLKKQLAFVESKIGPLETKAKDISQSFSPREFKQLKAFQSDVTRLKSELAGAEKEFKIMKTALKETLWETVKQKHIGGVYSSSKLSMLMALDARQREINTLMKDIGDQMGVPVVLPGDKAPDGPHIRVTICGSTELSSDIDVNITAVKCPPGTDTTFVTRFNEQYAAKRGDESGNDLDVNLYTEGVFPDFMKEIKDGPFKWTPEAKAKNDEYQDIISLIKVRKFAKSPMEWKQITLSTLMKTDGDKQAHVQAQFDQANEFFLGAEKEISTEIEKLKALPEHAHKSDMELSLIANNRLYEKYSKIADTLRQEYEDTGDQLKLAESKFELSKAHYFANEAALSEGVLRRVVINEQAIPGINKGRSEQAASLPEKQEKLKELLIAYDDYISGDTVDPTRAKKMKSEITLLQDDIEVIQHEQIFKQSDLNSKQKDLAALIDLRDQMTSEDDPLQMMMFEFSSELELPEDVDPETITLPELEDRISKLQQEVKDLRVDLMAELPEIELTPMQVLESFNENFGDILKEINHHSGSLGEAMYRSSKYLGRMCRDIETMMKDPKFEDKQDMFKDILAQVEKFGKAEGYKSNPDQGLLAVRKDKYSKEHIPTILDDAGITYTTAQQYRQGIIDLATQFNALARKVMMDD